MSMGICVGIGGVRTKETKFYRRRKATVFKGFIALKWVTNIYYA